MGTEDTRIKIVAEDQASSVLGTLAGKVGSVSTSFTTLEGAVGAAKSAFVAFAGVATLGSLAGMVRSVIEAKGEMHDLATESGLSVAALGAFKSVGSYTETSITSIASASEKLSKNLATSTTESNGAATAIKALGINFDDFRKMSPDQQMLTVASALDKFEAGSGKSAAAMMLFGKEGAKLLPFLKDLADDAEKVNGKLTEQETAAQAAKAAMADAYGDNLVKIKKESEGWKKELAEGVLPVMYEFTQAFLDSSGGAGGLKEKIIEISRDGTLANWARGAVTALSYLVDVVQALFSLIPMVGTAIGALAAATTTFFGSLAAAFGKLFSGGATGPMDFSGAFESLKNGFNGVKVIGTSAADDISAAWNQKPLGQAFRDSFDAVTGIGVAAETAKKPQLDLADATGKVSDAVSAAAKQAAAQERALGDLVTQINNAVTAAEAEASGAGKQTEADKLLTIALDDLRKGKISVTAESWNEITALLERLDKAEKEKSLNKDLKDLADKLAKGYEDVAAARKKENDEADAGLIKAQDDIDKMTLSKSALTELSAKRYDDKAALIAHKLEVMANAGAIDGEYDSLVKLKGTYEQTANKIREGAVVEATQAQAKESQKAWDDAYKAVEGSLTDALLRGFESGKDTARAFIDTLKNMFKTLVLKPIIQAIVQPVAAGVTGALGLVGPASAATGGGAGGVGSIFNGLSSLGNFGTSAAWTGFATSGVGSSLGLSSAFTDVIGSEMITSNVMSGLGSTIGTALPYVGIALALGSMFMGKGGGPKSGGQSILDLVNGNIGTSALQTAPAIDGGRMLFTPTTADADVYKLSSNALSAIRATATALGGAANGLTLGIGYDSDPQGSAQNRLIGMLAAGGRSSYTSGLRELGKDEATLKAAMSDEVSRLILAGLKESTLPQAMTDYFSQFTDIANMSGAEAAAAVEAATNANAMAKALQDAGGAFSSLSTISVQARTSILAMTGGLDAFIQKSQSFIQNYYSQEEQAAITATSILRQLGASGVTSDLGSKSDLRALIDSLDLSTTVGQQQFAALLNVSTSFASIADYLDTSGKTLQQLATLAPGGATLDALLGSADSAQITADQATLTAQGVQALIDQNASAYSRMIESLTSIDNRLATIETNGTLNNAAPTPTEFFGAGG